MLNINKTLLFGYSNNGDLMEDEMIEKVVKEFESKKDDFPSKDSVEGKKLVQTIREEAASDDEKYE